MYNTKKKTNILTKVSGQICNGLAISGQLKSFLHFASLAAQNTEPYLVGLSAIWHWSNMSTTVASCA